MYTNFHLLKAVKNVDHIKFLRGAIGANWVLTTSKFPAFIPVVAKNPTIVIYWMVRRSWFERSNEMISPADKVSLATKCWELFPLGDSKKDKRQNNFKGAQSREILWGTGFDVGLSSREEWGLQEKIQKRSVYSKDEQKYQNKIFLGKQAVFSRKGIHLRSCK